MEWQYLSDTPQLLQTGLRVTRNDPKPGTEKHSSIDLTKGADAFNELDAHMFFPAFDLPMIGEWRPAFTWCQQWWDFVTPFETVQIYFDGSADQTQNHTSIGVAAFVQCQGVWHFAGALATKTPHAVGSYEAEQAAGIVATKFLFDLLKLGTLWRQHAIDVRLCFDSTTVGHQAAGLWHAFSAPANGSLLRSLVQLCETKFQITLHHWHVRGHRGEAGNELVDELARAASEGHQISDIQGWFTLIQDHRWIQALEWAWIFFDPHYAPSIHDNKLYVPARPTTWPNANDLAVFQGQKHVKAKDQKTAQFELRFCTYNAMTLKSADQNYSEFGTPSKLENLLRQMDFAKVQFFAVQETRLKRLASRNDDRYLLYHSPASAQGHFGILVGISKSAPIGRSSDGRSIFITDKDVSIVHSDPRRLLLRIHGPQFRCLLLAGHAPHTGQAQTEIEEWWTNTQRCIPACYSQWDLVCLLDASARVGAESTHHIGHWDAEDADEKAQAFIDFVTAQNLLLPSTFEEYHRGPSTTWAHSRGAERRIDYVAVPERWKNHSLQSWVQQDFASAITCDDHKPVHLQVQFSQEVASLVKPRFSKAKLLNLSETLALDSFAQGKEVDWHVDVHSHAEALQQALYDDLAAQTTFPQRQAKTDHVR